MAQNARATEWSGLLESTRLALSTLRLDDLEKLAARAEQMLDAMTERDSMRAAGPRLDPGDRRKVLGEHRLLGSLLAATDRNLDLLRRLHGSPARSGAGGLDSRWVR
jgi:hypothetical protein